MSSVTHYVPLTKEEQIEALTKATITSQDKNSLAQLDKDIATLSKKLIDIQSGFTNAGIALDNVDKATGPDGSPLNNTGQSFFTQWDALSQRFNTLLTDSCELAGTVAGHCLFFNGTVLALSADPGSMSTDKILGIVKNFTDGLKDDQSIATGFVSSFSSLATDVGKFANTINEFAIQRIQADQTQLQNCKDDIKALQADIDSLRGKILALEISLGVTLWAVVAFAYFCPLFVLAIGGAAFATEVALIVKYQDQITTDQDNITKDNNAIAQLSADIEILQTAQTEMNSASSTDILGIVAAMNAFSSVWNSIITDSSSIQSYLESASDFKDSPPNALIVYLKTQTSLYSSFGQVLNQYASYQTNSLIERGYKFEPRPVEERLKSLVKLAKIHPEVKEAIQDILKECDLRVRV